MSQLELLSSGFKRLLHNPRMRMRKWWRICRRVSYSLDDESISKKLQKPPPPPPHSHRATLRAFELLKICLFKFFPFPLLRPKLFSNAPPNFYVKGRISHRDFLHIDQALNLDLVDLSFWAIRSRKRSIFLERLYIKRCNTCIPLERLYTSCWNSSPQPGKVQISPPHRHGRRSNVLGMSGGGGGSWSFELICA